MRSFLWGFAIAFVLTTRVVRADEAEARFSVYANFDDVHAYVGDVSRWPMLAPNALGRRMPRAIDTTRLARHRESIVVQGARGGIVRIDLRGAGARTTLVTTVTLRDDARTSPLSEASGIASAIEERFSHAWDSYAWQIVTADASAFAVGYPLGVWSLGTSNWGVLPFAMTLASMSGPIVHLAHGRPLVALASFGLRVGLTAVAVVAASLISWRAIQTVEENDITMSAFFAAACVTSSALDAVFLAKPTEPAEGTHVAPVLSLSPLGVAGAF